LPVRGRNTKGVGATTHTIGVSVVSEGSLAVSSECQSSQSFFGAKCDVKAFCLNALQ